MQQKLIYSGKILQDDKTLESYNIKEKDFIICMQVKKPAGGSSASASASASASPAAPAAPAAVKQEASPPVPTATAAQPEPSSTSTSEAPSESAPSTTAAPASAPSDPSFLTGQHLEVAINNMMEMGYPRSDVEAAMRAAFNNPARAVEYLISGIPEIEPSAAPAGSPGAVVAPPSATSPAPRRDDSTDVNLFEAAARYAQGGGEPHLSAGANASSGVNAGAAVGEREAAGIADLNQLRSIVEQDPQLLEPLLQEIMSNPQARAAVEENPEMLGMLLDGLGAAPHGDEMEDGDEEGGAAAPGSTTIQVTAEENDAISRLMELGFDRSMVIQAYFACEKNEELTANYLFEHGYDDDE